ncbi:MAG: hypothetical protein WCA77_01060 [Thermoplasmata archaeon]
MRSFVDITFAADGPSPMEIAEDLKRGTGLSFIVGTHDLVFEWRTPEEFRERLEQLHEFLKGTGSYYRVHTAEEEGTGSAAIAWPPALGSEPQLHPAYDRPSAASDEPPRAREQDSSAAPYG